MSEFLAEARVVVRPDTTRFRAELEAGVAAATAKPVVIPVVAAPLASGAGKALAVETEVATAAAKQHAAAMQLEGAAAVEGASAQAALARAERLSAESAALTAGAAEAASLKTTELARARSILATSSHAVAIAEKAVAAAIASGNVAIQASTQELLANARALEFNARAAVKDAIAHNADAAATAESAAAHAQATRGIVAETLALGGLRGATLAASAPFLIGATAAIVLSKSIKEASDAEEEFNKTSVVFGQSAEQIQHFAETTATSLGISSTEALKAAGIFGNLFRSIQISEPVSAELSETLVRLASDLASFNNADPSRVLEALRSGLVGQARPLRVFGIFLTQARAQQQALIDTGKEQIKELTNAEIVQARYNIILRDSVLAQGDFARTSDRMANQTRILKAQLTNMGEQIGKVVLPALNQTVIFVNDYVAAAGTAIGVTKDFAGALGNLPGPAGAAGGRIEGLAKDASKLYFRFALLGPVMGAATLAEKAFGSGAEEATEKTHVFANAIGALTDLIAALQTTGAKPLKNIGEQLEGLEVQALKIQTGLAPGGRGAEEENLRQQIEADKKAVAASKSGTAARKKALEALKSDQDQLTTLQEQAASDAKDRADRITRAAQERADSIKEAAEAAVKARDEADRALLELLGQRTDSAQRRVAAAGETASLSDDIRRQDSLQALIKIQIAKIRNQVKDEKTRKDAIRELRIALISSRQEEDALRKQRAQDVAAAKQTSIELDITFAETTGNAGREISARQRLIALLKKQQSHVKKGTNEWKRLRNDIAAQQAAIKDAKDQNEKAAKEGKTFAQQSFEFLQTQQGFASNLLGNLIPGFATAGLVGGSAGSATEGLKGAGQFGESIRTESAVSEARGKGVRPVQVDTTNHLLRQILSAVQGKHTQPPEIAFNRGSGSSAFDTL